MTVLPLGIGNADAALTILGDSCDYFQQFRELTENVIDQAVAAPNQLFNCEWSYEKGIYANGLSFGDLVVPAGTFKLACVDNGPGMSEATLTGPINNLFNSGTGHDKGNFGIGAKVAGLSSNAFNQLGLFFITKQQNKDALCALLTPQGLTQLEVYDGDGDTDLFPVLPCDALGVQVPDIIRSSGHGTAVVLLGHSADQDTVSPPCQIWNDLSGKKNVWLNQYLSRRYFQFPENLTVSGFELGVDKNLTPYQSNGNNTTHCSKRPVRSFDHFLQVTSGLQGEIQLSNATAYWFVIDSSANKNTTLFEHMMGSSDRSGSAVLWRDELYGREPAANLGKFGVYTGERNVFIMIKPDEHLISSDATRTTLSIHGESIHNKYMRDWAVEFRKQIKDTELGEWLAAQGHKQSGDSRNRILTALKKFGASVKVKGFRLDDKFGEVSVARSLIGKPAVDPNTDGASGSQRNGSGKGHPHLNLPVTIDTRGQAIGSPIDTDAAPDVIWKDKGEFAEGARTAAKYSPSGDNPLGVLILNRDFKFFGDLRAMLYKTVLQYSKSNDFTEQQLMQICENLVHHAVARDMSEIILRAYINAKAFGNKWHQDRLDELFSDATLTAMTLRSSTTIPFLAELFRGSAQAWLHVQ
jgi:hypothetical protein